ncbi:MAG: GNAT family N-acetyltransferase [Flavisolibacter sp.]
MNGIITTPRLRLREFSLDDTAFILELVNSKGWLRFIGDRNIHTREEAVHYLTNGPLKSYAENGFGLWLVELQDATPIGMCGLIRRNYLDHPDIGFAFLPQYASKGYGYESAKAILDCAENHLHFPGIYAIATLDNEISHKLIEKLGLQFQGLHPVQGSSEALKVFYKDLQQAGKVKIN